MSIQTWEEEYFKDLENITNDKEAILHGLHKYNGAKKENLNKHDVHKIQHEYIIRDNNDKNESVDFLFNTDTCALCSIHYNMIGKPTDNDCETCPLYLANGNVSCNDEYSPYMRFYNYNNPEPMIEALNNALEYIKNEKN